MIVTRAYRFALDLTPGQARDVERHAGAARFAFNWALAAVRANLAQRDAERSYGISEDQLTPVLGWNLPALRRAWNVAKREVAPWWAACSKEAFNTGLDALARALKNWADSRSGKRAGRLDAGTTRILSATVRRDGGRWHVSFTVTAKQPEHTPARPEAMVGVDVGIRRLAVLSTGERVPNPRHLDTARRKLARLSRAASRRVGPDRRNGQRPSERWERANTARNKVHHRIANLRRDGLHKLTTRLAREYGTVVVEDLNVAGMLTNRRLARHIADAGFAEIRRQLGYKTTWNGGRLVTADRWFPSSKTCSGCGAVKPKLCLSERVFDCDACGLRLDRDLNAALNLKQYVARSGRETRNGRGADHKTASAAGGDEASTPRRQPADKTGTTVVHSSPGAAR